LSWEKLFDQAEEDIRKYLWSVSSWITPPEGYSQPFLLLQALSCRFRGRYALKLMDSDIPEKYIPHRNRLKELYDQADNCLLLVQLKIPENLDLLDHIVNHELTSRIDILRENLLGVKVLADDGYLFEDHTAVEDDLSEVALEFIIDFQDMAFFRDELLQSFELRWLINIKDFVDKFEILEGLFKKYFNNFGVLKDTLQSIHAREYYLDRWWFTSPFNDKENTHEEDYDKFIKGLADLFQTQSHLMEQECPEPLLVIALAHNEIDMEDYPSVRQHLLKCRSCLDLVFEVHLANHGGTGGLPEFLPLQFTEAIYGPKKGPMIVLKGSAKVAEKFPVPLVDINEMPYVLAITEKRIVIPVQLLHPTLGEYDILKVKEGDIAFCYVPHGHITKNDVEEKIHDLRAGWAGINWKILKAFSQADFKGKIRDLEKILKETHNDRYAALNLAWLLFFANALKESANYLNLASKPTTPEEEKKKVVGLLDPFQRLADRLKSIISLGSPKTLEVGQEPVIDVWRLRCTVEDPLHRIGQLTKLFEKTQDGYVAYELSREFRHLGSYQPGRMDFCNYTLARNWAARALKARKPIDEDLRKWAAEPLKKIGDFQEEISEEQQETKAPNLYVPSHKLSYG